MTAVHQILDSHLGPQVKPGLCALSVMTKAPRAGKVKTRLTPPLTPEEAAALNICFLRDTAAAFSTAAATGPAQGMGVFTPLGQEAAYADILPSAFQLIPQRCDLFGDRLIAAAEDLFAVGFSSICLIDSDSPTVPLQAYVQAVKRLNESGDRVVLGPSQDGGYYLIGMNKLHRRLFEEIDWSTERVAEQTIARANEIGLELELLPIWYDVDDRATLRRLCDELLDPKSNTGGYEAPATREFLARLIEREGRDRIWPNE